jgi:hypothetical protein
MGEAGAGQVQVRGVGVADGQVEAGAAEVDGFAKAAPGDLGGKAVARVDGRGGEFVDRGGVAQAAGFGAVADNGADTLHGGQMHGRSHLFLL